ncbi:MAG: NAD(P)H-dependent flavin oxidoreductase [Alphaproteobacteria bacterium]
MPVIETALTRLLGIEHPILLAPMGSAAGGRLAAAVTHAGGLGLVGSGYASTAAIRNELAEAGNARVGIGFILWALERNPEALDVALEARPAAIMLSFGDPAPFTGHIREAGCKIICQVQTLAQAKEAADAGADIIIAQGRDAGGHSGTTRGTIGLVPAVVDAVAPIPVVAAGGIADGRGLAAALALGAAGILMGTRFTASRESLWDPAMKTAVLTAGGDQTMQTRVFDIVRGAPWPAIYPGRALRNTFSAEWHGREDGLAARQAEVEKTYLATAPDDFSQRVVWAGEGVDLVNDIPSAAEIIERIVAQAVATLRQSARLIKK